MDDAVWVLSDLAPDGRSYFVSIQCGPDRVFSPANPVVYALQVMRVAEYASYDAAVLQQMTGKVGLTDTDAADVIREIRMRRQPVKDKATAPLVFEPIVTHRNRKPGVVVRLDGVDLTQWTPGEAIGHACHVLSAAVSVELDKEYARFLAGPMALEEWRSRVIVDDLRNHRVADEDPDTPR